MLSLSLIGSMVDSAEWEKGCSDSIMALVSAADHGTLTPVEMSTYALMVADCIQKGRELGEYENTKTMMILAVSLAFYGLAVPGVPFSEWLEQRGNP